MKALSVRPSEAGMSIVLSPSRNKKVSRRGTKAQRMPRSSSAPLRRCVRLFWFLDFVSTTLLPPPTHCSNNRLQTLPRRRQLILHLRRNLRINLPAHAPVPFHLAQLQGQHFRRDRRQKSTKFGKPAGAGTKMIENQHLPSPADQQQRLFGRTPDIAFPHAIIVYFAY